MKILLTEEVAKRAVARTEASTTPIAELFAAFNDLSTKGISGNSRVHKLRNTSEQIYVYRKGRIRIYLTRKGEDWVVLSVEEANNSSKPTPLRGVGTAS